MFYTEEKAIEVVLEEPSMIFQMIREEHFELVDKILTKKIVCINTTDENGVNVITRLLMANEYKLVEKHINNKVLDINHQDNEGNTFGHVLANVDYKYVVNIIKKLKRNKEFMPNIKNSYGETMLDTSIKNNYLFTTVKILEDSRFNNIDIVSFKNLYDTYIKSNEYGCLTKMMNLDMIIDNLEKRVLLPSIETLLKFINENYEIIKEEIFSNKRRSSLDRVINEMIRESI